MSKEPKKRDLDEFLATARRRFAQAAEEEREIRDEFKTDLEYVAGEQWSPKVKREREAAGRPALTFNKLPSFTQAVANEARQNKTQIKLSPVDSAADKETAEVNEGLIRHIQYDSDADVAYETALDYSASGSFGYVRLLSDYIDEKSMDQELKIGCIDDPLSVYGVLIPACRGQKTPWAFVVKTLSKEEYEAEYPDSEVVSLNFGGEWDHDWVTEEGVRIAEYWWVEKTQKTLVTLEDGTTAYQDELPEGAKPLTGEDGKPKTRKVAVSEVKTCTINGVEILPDTETEWPDPAGEIPIVAVLGKKLIVGGKPRLFSVIRFAREPQQLYNYYKTGIAEQLSLASRAPYVGYLGQFKSKSKEWQSANTTNYAYLEADPVMVGGSAAPLPQRQAYEPPIQALSQGAMQEADDMKSTTSIFDAALGAQGNETSGIAIQRRQRQSSVSNYHFIDNLSRAYRTLGRMIARLIPQFYDTAREIRILGEDESQKVVKVNQLYQDEQGKTKWHRLDIGKYDVTVSTGPTYNTQRDEAFDMLTQFAQAYPALLQIAGDIVFRNSDMPGADELAERFKKTLPPNLQSDDEQGPQPVPPQVQAAMQQMGQQHDQLVQQVHQLSSEIETKRFELDSRERIAAMQEETKRTIALATLNSREGLGLLEQELAVTRAKLDQQHSANLQDATQQHQAAMQSAQQQHDAAQAQAAQQHQLSLAAAQPQQQETDNEEEPQLAA
jgi:hypothetical protein